MAIDHYDGEPKGATVTLSSCRRLTPNGLLFHVELGFAKGAPLSGSLPGIEEVKNKKLLGYTTIVRLKPSQMVQNHPKSRRPQR
jgi:hypothetical protein